MMTFGPGVTCAMREHVGELPVGHPVLDLDRDAMHFGHGGIGAADRKQRHQREIARERSAACRHRPSSPPTRRWRCSGAPARPAPNRAASACTPTAAKIASAISGVRPRRSSNSGRAILAQVPMTKPAAAAAHADQHALQRGDLAETRIDQADERNDDEWRPDQPDQRDRRPERAADAPAEHDRQVDDVRARAGTGRARRRR